MATKPNKVENVTKTGLTYTFHDWDGAQKTKKVKWDPSTQTGKLKAALAKTIPDKVRWNSMMIYNDVGGFRKKDLTVSRRIKAQWIINKPLSKTEVAKVEKAIRTAFKGAMEVETHVHGRWQGMNGTIMVWLREKVA